jgi:hypothetical protein
MEKENLPKSVLESADTFTAWHRDIALQAYQLPVMNLKKKKRLIKIKEFVPNIYCSKDGALQHLEP